MTPQRPSRLFGALAGCAELVAALVAAAVALSWSSPGRALAAHGAVDAVLAVLVLCATLAVPDDVGGRLRQQGARLLAAAVATSIAVAGIAWLAARLVPAGPARVAVVAAGVAPVEIATLSLAPLAGGEAVASAVLLIASTLFTILAAGPLLALLAGGVRIDSESLVRTLLLVVLAPMAVALVARHRVPASLRARASLVATAAVTVLIWLIGSGARLSRSYLAVAVALVILIVAGALVGRVAGRSLVPESATSVMLAGSMRDFAVAGGIADAAFGPAAAGPLALYGVLVMVWGSAVVALSRRGSPRSRRPE